jgi:hypothetical protein
VRADEKLTAFVELESATHIKGRPYIKIRRRLTRQIRTGSVKNVSPLKKDLNQAEEFPRYVLSPPPDLQSQNQHGGEKERHLMKTKILRNIFISVGVLFASAQLLPAGTITTFDPPGSTFTFPTAINPGGVITGAFTDASGVSHGFVRIP